MNDVEALEAACTALWGDPDDEPRPSPTVVGTRVIRVMLEKRCSFAEACAELVQRDGEATAAEEQARTLRART